LFKEIVQSIPLEAGVFRLEVKLSHSTLTVWNYPQEACPNNEPMHLSISEWKVGKK